jgi:DNA-binding SARP family transcriptional activator
VIEPSRGTLFRILGTVEAWTDEGWVQIAAPKPRALLATLLLHTAQPVSTDRLIAAIWGEEPPRRAPNLVTGYVHQLRQIIGDPKGSVLITRAPGYQIVLEPGQLDAGEHARLVAEGRQALAAGEPARAAGLLAAAGALWRGPALADVPPTPPIEAEAHRLEEARIEALMLRAEADAACGRHAQVVPELRRLLADNQLREELWALLMRVLHEAGRQAEALETYARAREVIADELGVDPGAALQQLYLHILNDDAAGSPSSPQVATGPVPRAAEPPRAPAQLPAAIPDFTGRAEQVAQLSALLSAGADEDRPGAVRVVVVAGSGGLGKTALAVHTAHQLASQFPDGQLYANLFGATQPADPAEVLARFLRDLGMDGARIPVGEEERAALYRTRLAGRRVLIVQDDARRAAQVQPLLPGTSSCAVLITARSRLPELVGSQVIDLDVLPPDEARALFANVAGEDRVSAEPEATAEVLEACAGLPLAIRIAGARLAARGGWTVRTLARRLADEQRRLDEFRVGNLAVRASFEVSYASLPGPDLAGGLDPAHVFRLLGLWAGPSMSLAAAAALVGEREDPVADALEVLVDAHLLESPVPDRYRFHDLLRVYAADRARTQEADAACRDAITRLLTWYLHTVEGAAAIISPNHRRVPLDPPPPQVRPLQFASLEDALAWCEAELLALVAAARLAAEMEMHEIAWKLPAASMSFFYRRSHWADWVASHETGLAGARQSGDRLAEAWMLNNLGMAHGQQRQPEAVDCFTQALAIFRELGDLRGESRAANNVAQAYLDLGRFPEALEAAKRALPIQQRGGFRYTEGIALTALGCACRELGRFDEAVEHVQEALVIFRELGDRMVEADALSDLGEAYLGMGRADDALGSLRESLAIWAEIGDRYGQATTSQRLGVAQRRLGDDAGAQESLSEAVRLFGELGDQARATGVQKTLAEMLNETDRGPAPTTS